MELPVAEEVMAFDPAAPMPTAHHAVPSSESEVTKALASVLSALSGGEDKHAAAMLDQLVRVGQFSGAMDALDNLDARMFHLRLMHPISKLTNAILSYRIKPHSDAAFLFEEHQFLRSHLREIFCTHEGLPAAPIRLAGRCVHWPGIWWRASRS